MDSNCWNGVGRLTKDAEFTVTKKGTPMSKFRMAVNDRRNDKTLFINVLCFGKMAENLNPRLVRGRPVSIQGKLNIDDYEDENQNKRSSICIMADEISLGKDPNGTPSETMEELEEAV
jgi:single-strand DNA-binding protein|tara:strand:+ start:919 stop:1272 length:354 start_codon:yes stop_codon:yes gene_type:complete